LDHTINAIRKSKAVSLGTSQVRSEFLSQMANASYDYVLQGAYDRGDEKAADKAGIELANKAGYAPNGLNGFLTRLADRYKNQPARTGLFASHPEIHDRIDTMTKQIAGGLKAMAVVAPRYGQSVPYKLASLPAAPGAPAGGAAPKSSGG